MPTISHPTRDHIGRKFWGPLRYRTSFATFTPYCLCYIFLPLIMGSTSGTEVDTHDAQPEGQSGNIHENACDAKPPKHPKRDADSRASHQTETATKGVWGKITSYLRPENIRQTQVERDLVDATLNNRMMQEHWEQKERDWIHKWKKLANDHHELNNEYGALEHRYQETRASIKRVKRRCEALEKMVTDSKAEMAGLRETQKEERAQIQALELEIKEQESIITRAHQTNISTLTNNVSCELPDDTVRQKFLEFFDGDFHDWCLESCVERIQNVDSTADMLAEMGILGRDSTWPSYLNFDMTASVAPAVLLQAGLVKLLCQKFLGNPYFLAQIMAPGEPRLRMDLSGVERAFIEDEKAGAEWRAHTVSLLEDAFPPSPAKLTTQCVNMLEKFYPSLLRRDLDFEEFSELVARFARLAVRLWKLKTEIGVMGLNYPTLRTFDSRVLSMVADPSVSLQTGDRRLDGRPIPVVVRPLILSMPLDNNTNSQPVVWSKATVWASNAAEPEAGQGH